MTFDERKKQVQKHTRLRNKNQVLIDEHPFVVSKRKLISKHNSQIAKLLEECTHDEFEKQSFYFPGSYYDQSYTEYWNKCVLCGMQSERKRVSNGYYG